VAPLSPPGATELRRHARRVALGVTIATLVLYVLAAAAADVLVLHRLSDSVDGRLENALQAVLRSQSLRFPVVGNDPDDAPVFAWRAGGDRRSATVLIGGAPALPRGLVEQLELAPASTPMNAMLNSDEFRFLAADSADGLLVVGSSLRQLSDTRTTLLVGEGVTLPVVLIAIFLVAEVIGRRAAAPVERARRDQLEFTADASHELRTPLSVIEAEVGLSLLTERDAPAYRAALERVAGETRRLRGIVDELMLLARADSLPPAASEQMCDLGPVAAQCAARFSPILAERGGALILEVSDERLSARLPVDWLDRLVSVLVDNACRYAGEGGTVRVSVSSDRGRATLLVEDSGPGIPPAERDAVRRRFHRASHSSGGAGLGLSIADAIVTSTGGTLEIGQSGLGGASVRTSWPLAKDLRP
jgi:two-component system sensor histidine kinase CiaH